jgi:hypothetical protein
MALLRTLAEQYAGDKLSPPQADRKALARLCHMLFCANEFLYVG